MKAEILSIGTELLLGTITDTNASWLAQRLADLGIDLFYVSQVGDNLGRLAESLRRAISRSDIVITTGGVGPTEDDLTREAISAVLGEQMAVQPEVEAQLRAFFERRGVQMPERNVKQATLIPSARALSNPIGTAPGWWTQPTQGEFAGKIVVTMPGVPHEMKRMWTEEVEPALGKLSGGGLIYSINAKVVGVGESTVEESLGDLIHSDNPTLATYAKQDGVHVRVTAKASTREQAERLTKEMVERVQAIFGSAIYGYNDDTLEQALVTLLISRKLTLATMESVTGGLVAHNLTNVPGASDCFLSGLVSYSPAMKVKAGVPQAVIDEYGVVSEQCALAMATAARAYTGAEIGISTTGVAGPSELEGQPVGTVWLGIDYQGERRAVKLYYRSTRPEIKRLAAMAAVNLARLALLKGLGRCY